MRTDYEAARVPWDWLSARERCLREAQRYTRCPTLAEDAVQEALLRAWKTRSGPRNNGQPMPWLLQITRNEALRLMARRRRDSDRSVLVSDPDEVSRPDEFTDAAQARVDVQSALSHLGESDRTLVNLRYGEELTHSNIADLMNIPVGTCKVRLHRLRKQLHAMLADAEEGQK